MDRDLFLTAVRYAVADAALPVAPAASVPAVAGREDPVAAFAHNLEAVDGKVHRPENVDEVVSTVLSILAGAGARSFLSWDPAYLPVPGIVDAAQSAGLRRIDGVVPDDPDARHAHQRTYFDVDAGITGAIAAFAVSGTIVLPAGEGMPRMASLIPDLHVALLPHDAMHTTVSEWAADHPDALTHTSNLVFITGPSRTGDIEMRLNLGVHGPRTIHVVLVPDTG